MRQEYNSAVKVKAAIALLRPEDRKNELFMEDIAMTSRWTFVAAALAASLLGCAGKVSQSDDGVGSSSQAVTSSAAASSSDALSTASLQLKVLTNSCGANQAQDFFEVTNEGTTPIKLSDISVKFWVDDTSGQSVVPHMSTGGCVTNVNGNPACVHQVAGVTATPTSFAPSCGPDPSHQANWEIAVTDTDSATLPPGAVWRNIQAEVTLANYSSFIPGTAKWFSPCLAGSAYEENSHFAVYYQGNLVFSNGIDAPDCRAPHGTQQLTGHITPAQAAAPLVGPVAGSTVISLGIALPVTVPNDGVTPTLENFVQDVSNPSSPNYRHYLDVPTFAARYGSPFAAQTGSPPTSVVGTWATSHNLTLTHSFPNNLMITVSGTAAAIEQAFYVDLNYYLRHDGTQFYGPDREPSVDATAPPLLFIENLNNMFVPMPAEESEPSPTGSGTQSYYLGDDVRKAYAYRSSTDIGTTALTGAGQCVGLLVSGDGFSLDDVSYFWQTSGRTKAGLPLPTVKAEFAQGASTTYQPCQPSQCPNNPTCGQSGSPCQTLAASETTLDIQMALTMAPEANIVAYYGDYGAAQLQAMATDSPLCSQLSSSWNIGEGDAPGDPTVEQELLELAAQGQSFFRSSGDSPDIVTDPSGYSPYLTVVGATYLVTNTDGTFSYENASYWSDGYIVNGTTSDGATLNGGTTSAACNYPPSAAAPYYQQNISTINGASPMYRNVPDVSMVGNDLEVDSDGQRFTNILGTSFSAPLWAGFMALVNEQNSKNGLGPIGFANPVLYAIGQTAGSAMDVYKVSFNDCQTGWIDVETCGVTDEQCGCNFTGGAPAYRAGPGYDVATGWGSPTFGLINQLTSSSPAPNRGVAVGQDFVCAARDDSTVSCWGDNTSREIGNPAAANPQLTPISVSGLPPQKDTTVSSIVSNDFHACALLSDHSVWCWGGNGLGQLGDGTSLSPTQAITISGFSGATALAAGYDVTCALMSDKTVKCTGLNDAGQLGDGVTESSLNPVPVSGLTDVSAIAAGGYSACAVVATDGHVECWGENLTNDSLNYLTPTPVLNSNGRPLVGASSVAVGYEYACALMNDSSVECWGYQIGNGTSGLILQYPTPVVKSCSDATDNLTGVTQVVLGWINACAVMSDGTVQCWGDNSSGELGDGTTNSRTCPAPVTGLENVTAISANNLEACSLAPVGISCWGYDYGSNSFFKVPQTVHFF
ncbi:MAG: protease pro-enzyme activation domain-containing protein [Polyangiaceae bacterium]